MKQLYFLNRFDRRSIRQDLLGGLTSAVVALPLAIAFGVSSGAGAIAGLYGAIILGFFAAWFGGTHTQISGPTGPMTVVMTAVIMQYVSAYPDTGLTIAFTVVIMAGGFQILFGLLKLGQYLIQIPYAVVSGFMTGIGVIIIILQLPALLGLELRGSLVHILAELPQHLPDMNSWALVGGLATLMTIFLWPKKVSWFPASLAALLIWTLVILAVLGEQTVSLIGTVPSGLPELHWPQFESALLLDMVKSALLLAALGAIDSLLTSLVADHQTRTLHDSDRELIGQGVGNALAGLFGGLPGAGATMRTVVNIRAGSQTALSGMFHSLVLLAVVLGLGGLAQYIPLAVLAGILIKVGIDIIDWGFIRKMRVMSPFSQVLMLLVLLMTVFVDLITAVLIGVFIANLVTIRRLSDVQLAEMKLLDSRHALELKMSDEERRWLESTDQKLLLMYLKGPFNFGMIRGLTKRLAEHSNYKVLVLDLSDVSLVGLSSRLAIADIISNAKFQGHQVVMAGLNEADHESLRRLNLLEGFHDSHFQPSRLDALAFASRLLDHPDQQPA